jgi:adenylyltransferase/sulfurtransferase
VLDSKVLIVGVGGLGSPVAMYLAAAGVGNLILVDFDQVELSNLQRQIVHDTSQLGQYKVISAKNKLDKINPNVKITAINQKLDLSHFDVDVVVDCSDNFATRFMVNKACIDKGIPLVSGAALRWGGQVAVFNNKNGPCYQCLYDNIEEQAETCSESGIIAPLVGVIGSIQALEVMKVILNIGEFGYLLLLDAKKMQWRKLKLHKDPSCSVCG